MSLITTALTLAAAVLVAFSPATEATTIQSLQLDTTMAAAAVEEQITTTSSDSPGYICNVLKGKYGIDLTAFGPFDYRMVPYNSKLGEYFLTFCENTNRAGCNGDAAVCFLDTRRYQAPTTLATFAISDFDRVSIQQYKDGLVRLTLKNGEYQSVAVDTKKIPTVTLNFRCTNDSNPEWAIDTLDTTNYIVDVPHQNFCNKQ